MATAAWQSQAAETRDRQDQHANLVGGGVLILAIPRLGRACGAAGRRSMKRVVTADPRPVTWIRVIRVP